MNANPHLLMGISEYHPATCSVVFLWIYPPFGSSVLVYLLVYLLTFCHMQLTKYSNVCDLNRSSTDNKCQV